jgi:murein DD-endopeptidase MepM/ murein hydrolase activator NlpD
MRALCPLPLRDDWTPSYLRARGDGNRDFAFNLRDAEGAPCRAGGKFHSAVDWFAPGETPVKAPVSGTISRVQPSRGNTGQVFGGVVDILEPSGFVWVMRHVEPGVVPGQQVDAGETVAILTPWRDGGPHLHLEIWRTQSGGYWHENMIDPKTVEWVTASTLEKPPPELPFDGSLRLSIKGHPKSPWAGWAECSGPLRWIAKEGLEPGAEAAISWRGNTWRGPVNVTNVAKHLVTKYLDKE